MTDSGFKSGFDAMEFGFRSSLSADPGLWEYISYKAFHSGMR